MLKTILAGSAALAIAGSSLVYAQQRDHGPGRDGRGPGGGPRLSLEDRAAFTDARIAALKAGLKLTPEQDKNWAPFEAALRDIAKAHQERMAMGPAADGPRARRRGPDRDQAAAPEQQQDNAKSGTPDLRANSADPRVDPGSVARMRREAEMLTNTGAALKKLADAQEPLFTSLDDSQKNRFRLLSHILMQSNPSFAQMRGHGGRGMHRMHERHHGPDDRRGMRGPEGGGPAGPAHEMDKNTGTGGAERL
jgi:zinc resistance-associated protein